MREEGHELGAVVEGSPDGWGAHSDTDAMGYGGQLSLADRFVNVQYFVSVQHAAVLDDDVGSVEFVVADDVVAETVVVVDGPMGQVHLFGRRQAVQV